MQPVIAKGCAPLIYSYKAAFDCYSWPSQAGGQWCLASHLNSVPLHFMFRPPTYHEAVEFLCAAVDSQ